MINHTQSKIESAISIKCTELLNGTKKSNPDTRQIVEVFCELLQRGGKRLRGSLVLHAYKTLGGRDEQTAIQAAVAIEMLHTYLLIIDDIQDNSLTRRGGSAAHVLLAEQGNTHMGVALALNSALFGVHKAQQMLGQLPVEPDTRINVLDLINRTLISTAHGQTSDLTNQLKRTASAAALRRTMLQKTSEYSFSMPLSTGTILSGANPAKYAFINKYAAHAGVAFQLANDLNGIKDDLAEGKQTALVSHAIKHATKSNREVLRSHLGQGRVSESQYVNCLEIFKSCGAIEASQRMVESEIAQAKVILEQSNWPKAGQPFLNQLADYILSSAITTPL